MKMNFLDLIDFEKVNTLLEGFNKSTGFVTAILDLNGKVLSKSGWSQICTEFHRKNPDTSTKCTISDTELANKMAEGEKYHFYTCLNGLVDVAVPVIINGEHIANLFSGQFLFEEPDRMFFKEQAGKYGFNEKNYLEALAKVPVVSKEKVLAAMDFLLNMTQLISETTFQKSEQLQVNEALKKSEERFRSTLDSMLEGCQLLGFDWKYIYLNRTAEIHNRRSNDELVGNRYMDMWPEIEQTEVFKTIKNTLETRVDNHLENEFVFPDGSHAWFDLSIQPVPEGIFILSIDITERKKAEKAQRESEEKYRLISDNSDDWIYWILPDGIVHYVSPACERVTGYSPIEFTERPELNQQIVYDADKEIVKQHFLSLKQDNCPHELEYRIITKSGELRWISHICSPIFSSNGEYMGRRATNRNITESKYWEEQLFESEFRFSKLYENGPFGMVMVNNEFRFKKVNPAFCAIMGYSEAELQQFTFKDVSHPDDVKKDLGNVQKLIQKEISVYKTEKRYIRKDGQIIWGSLTVTATYDREGKFLYNLGIIEEITHRKNTEEVLQENNSRLELAMQSANMAWWEMDIPTGDVVFNQRKADMLGYPPERFKHYSDFMALVHPDDHEATMNAMRSHLNGSLSRYEIEYRIKTNSGNYKWFFDVGTVAKRDSKGAPLKISGLVLDIDFRKQAEERIREKDILFRKLSANVPDLIYQFTRKPDGNYCVPIASDGIQNIFGCTPEEVLDDFTAISRVIYPEDAERVIRDIEYSAAHLTYFTCEFRVQIPGREIQWIYSKSTPERLSDGSITWYGFNVDITQKKQAEEILNDTYNLFRIAGEKAKLGGWKVNLQENRCFWSEQVAAIHQMPAGYSPQVEDGISFYAPEWRGKITELFTRCAQDGIPYDEEMEIITSTGKRVWVRTIGEAVRDNQGKIFKVQGAFQDISERKKSEEFLRKSEERFANIFSVSPAAMTITRLADGKYLNVNQSFLKIFEFNAEEVIGHTSSVINIIREEARNKLIKEQIGTTGFVNAELIAHTKSGREINLLFSSIPMKIDEDDCLVTTMIDITERKQAEDALYESEERFRKAFAEAPMGIAMENLTTGKLFSSNNALCEMLGFTEAEFQQLTFMDVTYPEDRAADIEAFKSLIEGRIQKHVTEKRYLKKNGEIIWGIRALTKISSTGGRPDYALAMIKDITDRKNAEEELQRLNIDLEQRVKARTSELEGVNKELETFTYSVSHDLKAPLRGIDGYSKLLLDNYKTSLNDEGQKFIETIRSSTLQMNQLIDDLLDYSRLERSHLSIGRIKIIDFIKSLLSIYNADLEAFSFKVNMEIVDIEIIADPKGLTIALRNLLENAIKFTKGNEDPLIQIKLEENNLSWIISVKDNGIGFDMKYHQKIFEIFQRLQRVEDYPGTGIGLAMVSKAMQRMHGRAWAESVLGMGSTFYLEVPKNQ